MQFKDMTPDQQFELGRRLSESAEMRKRLEDRFAIERDVIADKLSEALEDYGGEQAEIMDQYRERALLSHRQSLNERLASTSPDGLDRYAYEEALKAVKSKIIDFYTEASVRVVSESRRIREELDEEAVSAVAEYSDYPDFERYLRKSLNDEDIKQLNETFIIVGREFPSYKTSKKAFRKLIATDGQTSDSAIMNDFLIPYLALQSLVAEDHEVATNNYMKIFKLIRQLQGRYETLKKDGKSKFAGCIILGKRCMIDKEGKLQLRILSSDLSVQLDFFTRLQSFVNGIIDAYDMMEHYVDRQVLENHFTEMKRIRELNGQNINMFKKIKNFTLTFQDA